MTLCFNTNKLTRSVDIQATFLGLFNLGLHLPRAQQVSRALVFPVFHIKTRVA